MKPERWQQLSELFHAALERAPEERAAFLDEACAGDESLHKQVEDFIAGHEAAGSFIDSPAIEVAAHGLAADRENPEAELASGETVSHYRIISPLGSGGMGEVYLAQDTKLGREVALKLLPDYLTHDEDRVRRLQREARAASSLNHPNIITIYEIGQLVDRHSIASEYIDGLTLRQLLKGDMSHAGSSREHPGLQLSETLGIAMQVADAPAAARKGSRPSRHLSWPSPAAH
jgi:eukaryotic-like serine/threonine-protein kinase